MRHAVLIIKAGINQPEAVMGLRKGWFQTRSFFERRERVLIFLQSIVGISEPVKGIHTCRIERGGFRERLRCVVESRGAKTRRSQIQISLFVIRFELRSSLKRIGSFGKTAGVKISLAEIVLRGHVIRFRFHRLFQHVNRFGGAARLVINVTQPVQSFRIFWVEMNRFLVSGYRFFFVT